MSETTVPDLRDYDIILVASSGGKDSQVMLDLVAEQAKAAGVLNRVVVVHNDLGKTARGHSVEWPGTAELARKQAEHYGVRFEITRRKQGGLFQEIQQRGKWPSAKARYCTSDQKTSQAMILVTALVSGIRAKWLQVLRAVELRPVTVLYCVGLRAQESKGRAAKPVLAKDTTYSNGRRTVMRWHPILHWTEAEVWARIKASGVPHHPAYDQGMSRLSCSLCVLASKADLMCAARLRPELAAEYAELEEQMGHQFRADISMRQIIELAAGPEAER